MDGKTIQHQYFEYDHYRLAGVSALWNQHRLCKENLNQEDFL